MRGFYTHRSEATEPSLTIVMAFLIVAGMRKTWLLGLLLVAFCLAVPAAACEKCGLYFDAQALQYCKYCIQGTACGYFECQLSQDKYTGMVMCGSTWSVEGEDQCFTDYGVAHNSCGPQQQVMAPLPSELRLVSVRIRKPASTHRHQKS